MRGLFNYGKVNTFGLIILLKLGLSSRDGQEFSSCFACTNVMFCSGFSIEIFCDLLNRYNPFSAEGLMVLSCVGLSVLIDALYQSESAKFQLDVGHCMLVVITGFDGWCLRFGRFDIEAFRELVSV